MENTDEIIRLVAKEAIKEFDKEQKEKKKILPPNVSQKLKLKKILQDEGYDLVIPIQYLNSNDMDSIIKYIETGDIDLGNERIYNYIQKTNLS